MRTPEGISAARVKGFTSENVARLVDIYEPELKKLIIKPTGYSMLMTRGLQLCNTGTVKVLA
jgi:hypothetical protein